MRNVVITGVGMVTPMGNTLEDVAGVYLRGKSVVRPAVSSTPERPRVCAYVEEDLAAGLPSNLLKLLDRTSLMAVRASDAAMADAGLAPGSFDPYRMGTMIGCGCGPTETNCSAHEAYFLKDYVGAFSLLKMLPNAPGSHISMRHAIKGECSTFTIACSSSATAIGTAFQKIRHGYLDMALTGGVESPLAPSSFRGWEAMRVMARIDPEHPDAACRPYSKNRTGIVLGEGSVLYVLEEESHAKARGARILARITGYATASDAAHITLPDKDGQIAAMRAALADADLKATDIGYINSHGTATGQGDTVEIQSMGEVFGSDGGTPISSTKAIHGHLLGGSGAIELLASIIALKDGILAPTVNLDEVEPGCALDFIPNVARTGVKPGATMSNSFAFGGSNASLILQPA